MLLHFFLLSSSFYKVRTCALRPRFTRKGVYKLRRFWATYVNRKRAFFSFNMPWCPLLAGGISSARFLLDTSIKSLLLRYQVNFVLLSVFTVIETFCPKICLKSRLKTAKSPLVECLIKKRRWINSLFFSWLIVSCQVTKEIDIKQSKNFFSHLKNNNSNNDDNNILQ